MTLSRGSFFSAHIFQDHEPNVHALEVLKESLTDFFIPFEYLREQI
jgi:hypothetical protein